MGLAEYRSRSLRCLAAAAALGLASAGALADEEMIFGNPAYFCRNGAFPGGGEYDGPKPMFTLARVKGSPGTEVHFFMDYGGSSVEKGCPKAQGQLCASTKYLIPGDEVIVSKTREGLACSWYEAKKHFHGSVGWLPLSSLDVIPPDQHPTMDRWLGRWKNGDDTLTVTAGSEGAALHVDGEAYWPARGALNESSGAISGHGTPTGNVLEIEDEWGAGYSMNCGIRVALVGKFLIASDNHQCNGFNVNFDGVYLRQGTGP